MTIKVSETRTLNGIRFIDKTAKVGDLDVSEIDLFIAIVGWEDRAKHILEHSNVSGKKAFLISFDDDGISDEKKSTYIDLAEAKFTTVEPVKFCNARQVNSLRGELENFANELTNSEYLRIGIDYSSMPRMAVQTLFRLLISEGVCPQILWMYSSGEYDRTLVVEKDFHQGIDGDLFSVHGSQGSGAMSKKRIGIASLGGDQELVSSFLRHENYEEVFFVDAPSISSPKLQSKIEQQRLWLQAEHGADQSSFFSCDEHDVVSTLSIFSDIILKYESHPNVSFDIFCAGPKTHSIAASAIVSRFDYVRLLGRVPSRYERLNVSPTGTCSVTTVSDYTNIRMADLLPQG